MATLIAPSAAPRWMRWLLVASLALNLLIGGLFLGSAFTDGGPGRRPRPADMALGPLASALAPEDRHAILGSLRGREELRPLTREERATAFGELVAALRAEPFDAARASRAIVERSSRVAQAEEAMQEALVARLAAMSPADRAAFADRLEDEIKRGPRRRAD